MAKKAQAQAAAAAAASAAIDPAESATTQVNIADFTRTRDSVIVALATLLSSVQELSRAYINHANTVLAPGRGPSLNSDLTSILTESGLLMGGPVGPVVVEGIEEGKKKRKRVPHDPNAPKRALTPYFLYMQHARAQIHKELGESARPKEVADEGTRRWGEMTPAEKSIWDDKYQKNLAAYRVRMQAYKAGEPVPSEEEAARLVEAGKIPALVAGVDEPDSDDEAAVAAVVIAPAESSDEDSPEPVKEPTPPKAKRRKSDKVAATEPVKETPKAKKEKKAKKEEEPAPATKPASEKKKKTRKG